MNNHTLCGYETGAYTDVKRNIWNPIIASLQSLGNRFLISYAAESCLVMSNCGESGAARAL